MAHYTTIAAESTVIWRVHYLNLLNGLILGEVLVLGRILHSMSCQHLHALHPLHYKASDVFNIVHGSAEWTLVNAPWPAQVHLPIAACS